MDITYKLAGLLDKLAIRVAKMPYWVEIITENPKCIYYFGHFDSSFAAKLMYKGYIKDLMDEDAKIISVQLKQCQPKQLTVVQAEKGSI